MSGRTKRLPSHVPIRSVAVKQAAKTARFSYRITVMARYTSRAGAIARTWNGTGCAPSLSEKSRVEIPRTSDPVAPSLISM